MSTNRHGSGRPGFSVFELVIVLVVLGVAATIVGPRLSRAAAVLPSQSGDLLEGRLKALRGAVEAYAREHGGRFPSGDGEMVRRQLLQYTDFDGRVSPHRTGRHRFGPYLAGVPELPVGANMGGAEIVVLKVRPGVGVCEVVRPGRMNGGWVYDPATGRVTANVVAGEVDGEGREYSGY
ncbi:MAG: prepilin-type N-terminal cleavage/methylation domain-containing protein [Phycisphaerae bacterium]|nr:prepilin-type N-terminal cleavage/methylation domain-containing protein [Tepidisphaeraceae bacterium]